MRTRQYYPVLDDFRLLPKSELTQKQKYLLRCRTPEPLFNGGACHIFAAVLWKRLNDSQYQPHVLEMKGRDEKVQAVHAFLLAGDFAIDINGVSTVEGMVTRFWNLPSLANTETPKLTPTTAEELLCAKGPDHRGIELNCWGHNLNPKFLEGATARAWEVLGEPGSGRLEKFLVPRVKRRFVWPQEPATQA